MTAATDGEGKGPQRQQVVAGSLAHGSHEKMIIVLDDKNKTDLEFLTKLPSNVVEEFCKISLEFIRKGSGNKSMFKAASEKLGVTPDVVEHAVDGLGHLFTEASRHLLTEIDFLDSLLVLSFPEELNNKLKDFYLNNRAEVRTILAELSPILPSYYDLDWRLDIQVASRSMRNQVTPVYLMKLDLHPEPKQTIMLQADFNNLKHLTKELENALNESKTGYFSRIMRNIK